MDRAKVILCLDQPADTCELLSYFFERRDYRLIECDTPEELIRHTRNEKYAAIIAEFHLGGMDGTDLCRVIRTFDQTIPIVFFTAEARPENKAGALAAGAQSYFTKPQDFEMVVQTVIDAIAKCEINLAERR